MKMNREKRHVDREENSFNLPWGIIFSSHVAIYYFTVKDLVHDGDGKDNNDKLNAISANLGEVRPKRDKSSL